MSDLDGLINLIPIGDIAKKLGIDESVAKAAVAVAVPAIVGGLAANAKNEDGAKSLEKALGKHKNASTDLKDVDSADGAKIVKHVFGDKKDKVVAAVASKSGGPDIGAIVGEILPIIAPIVLAYLAKQFLGGGSEPAAKEAEAPESSGGIGDLLGGLLSSKEGQDIVGGLLGGLLGGNK
jgi:hypothetical protein